MTAKQFQSLCRKGMYVLYNIKPPGASSPGGFFTSGGSPHCPARMCLKQGVQGALFRSTGEWKALQDGEDTAAAGISHLGQRNNADKHRICFPLRG